MKTNTLRLSLLAGAALALGTGLAIPTLIAGPGLDYWRNLGKPESKSSFASPVPVETRTCTDARLVPITETKTTWHNGRGPLQTIEVGKKLVCTSCDTPIIVMKPSGHNARGAMAPVAIKGTHDCSKVGCGSTVAGVP
jgi:hypothetical protein